MSWQEKLDLRRGNEPDMKKEKKKIKQSKEEKYPSKTRKVGKTRIHPQTGKDRSIHVSLHDCAILLIIVTANVSDC